MSVCVRVSLRRHCLIKTGGSIKVVQAFYILGLEKNAPSGVSQHI